MSKLAHGIYVYSMALIVIIVTVLIGYYGHDYYTTPLENRFYHEYYDWFKPSGIFGHGLGVLGTFMIFFGVVFYIVSKKYRLFEGKIRLKYLLEFHIFLCTLGPILILFHTSFKFGGIVSVAFWSMALVVISGVAGRYLYIQIPRNLEGKILSKQEVSNQHKQILEKFDELLIKNNSIKELAAENKVTQALGIIAAIKRWNLSRQINAKIREQTDYTEAKKVVNIIRKEWQVNRRIYHMERMQKYFGYWHLFHKPFAIIMAVIVVLHVTITMMMGYTWIF